tara:strand:+ start:446 stop:784 length:339 start_codon:yes stop_codon:yes gene_type:complete
MAILLEQFASSIENPSDDEDNILMNDFMSTEDTISWEKLVEVFDSIDILHVGRDVVKVSKKFQTSHEEDIAILAYVKVLEMMVRRAKDTQRIAVPTGKKEPKHEPYEGSMFG